MYFSAADEAEFGQQAEHATVVEVGVYPEAACAALPGQCHGAAHEFGRYALSFDLLCDGQTVQDDVWGLVEPRAVDFGIGRFAVEDDSPVSDDESCVSTIVRGRIRGRCRPLYVPPPGSRSAIGDFPAGASAPGPGG